MRSVYPSVPDIVLELLLCVPAFHPLPAHHDRHTVISTDSECVRERERNNPSPHHVDFAMFMYQPRVHYEDGEP